MLSRLRVHPKAVHFNAFYLLAVTYQKKEKKLVLIQVSSLSEARVHLIHERKENNLWAKIWCKEQKKYGMKLFDEAKNNSMDSKTGGREGNYSYKQRFYRYILYPLYCMSNWKRTRNNKMIGWICIYIAAALHQFPYYTKQKQPLWYMDKNRKKESTFIHQTKHKTIPAQVSCVLQQQHIKISTLTARKT